MDSVQSAAKIQLSLSKLLIQNTCSLTTVTLLSMFVYRKSTCTESIIITEKGEGGRGESVGTGLDFPLSLHFFFL